MPVPACASVRRASRSRAQTAFQIAILAVLIVLLVHYKSAAGVRKIRQTRATGVLRLDPTPLVQAAQTSVLYSTIAYLNIVWPALLLGILISAAGRTALLQTLPPRILSGSTVRNQLAGALAGAPLMLCSCCVAPIFPSVYERTHKVAPAVALTLASPSLNPAALALSFMLLPLRLAGARLIMALLLLVVGPVVAAAVCEPGNAPEKLLSPGQPRASWLDLLAGYADALRYVIVHTVPLIVIGIGLSMVLLHFFPPQLRAQGPQVFAVASLTLLSVLLALPSFFEIPLALAILAAGGPMGGALAVLFAGPAINLPSLLVIGRHSGWKAAAALGALVWAMGFAGGLAVGS